MKASKLLLLLGVLLLGGVIEAAWRVRTEIDLGPSGCRVLRGKFYGPSYSFEGESRSDVADGVPVEVTNAFGSVEVKAGAPGAVHTRLRTVVYLPGDDAARAFAAEVRVTSALDGGTLKVGTNRGELDGRDVGFETHLQVEVPPGARVVVRNEHGSVQVEDVGAADVESSYDSLRVDRVNGDAVLKSRHGDVTVSAIGGTLSLSSRYGDVEARDVTGRLKLESAHGDVTVTQAGGLDAEVHYGDLTVAEIRGDLSVRGGHAEVRAEGVTGGASIETSYQDATVAKIGGDVRLKAEHGALSASDVRGALIAETSYNDVTLAGVEGPVEVKIEHGGLHAERLAKGARVTTFGDDVEIDGFRGAVIVDVKRGSVHLVPDGPLTEAVTASVANGGITLEVTGSSRFELLAAAEPGEVEVSLPGLSVSESSPARVAGTLGGGGSLVKLTADHGDVHVESRSALASKKEE